MEWLRYHIKPEREELPLDWGKIFGRESEMRVEIGFGNGEFLLHQARKMPEVNFIGFELSITSFVKAQKKFYRYGVENVRLVMIDGRFGLRELFPNDSVSHVYINFPCPWSKKKHEGRRITHGDFVETLAAVLKSDGVFELMTDNRQYSQEVYDKILSSGLFRVFPVMVDKRREVQTRYEKKWLSMGRHTYLIRAEKVRSATVERIAWGGEDVHQKIDFLDSGKLKLLVGKVFKSGKKVFVVKEVFSSSNENTHLLKIVSSDGGFEQHYNILVEKHRDFWIVKLDNTCQPYRTPSVKWSVREISKKISLT